ncbi:protein rapunzel-like [Garra rufa]|uniref:protein rapunzel-like n=1 Tax=Garra rufa TaxID=137080 RepID=UPI003CCE8CF1
MAEQQQIKVTAAKVLCCVEKISSFASNINPLFGIVTSIVRFVRKGLVEEEDNALAKDFKQIHEKLETISKKNKQTLQQIHINEIKETYGKYEKNIKQQYEFFNTMVESVKQDQKKENCIVTFLENYNKDKMDISLNAFYLGVTNPPMFGKPILQVYLENCQRNKKVMEARCSHIAYLFYIGLMSLMAYHAAREDDEDEVRDKWIPKVKEIEAKMQEVLDQCTEEN